VTKLLRGSCVIGLERVEWFYEREFLMDIVSRTCKEKLEELGIRRAGQRVKICSGKWAGLVREISDINWENAEIKIVGLKRWFGPGFFLVLDPDYTEVVEKVWEGPVNKGVKGSVSGKVQRPANSLPKIPGFLPRRIS
jgi:hypothetical protein